jgi:hypothetical protein
LGRLLAVHLAHGFVPWRWLLVPAVVAFVAFAERDFVAFDYHHQRPLSSNLWDLLPYMLCESPGALWAFAFGFALVSGDSLARSRRSGTAALTLTRASSRTSWWATHFAAIGIEALAYAALATASTLLVALVSLPFSLEPSLTARTEVIADMLYPRWPSLSMPAFNLAIAARAFLGLWILGAVLSLASLFSPRPLVPLLLAVGWVLVSDRFFPYVATLSPLRWLGLWHLISYVSHFKPGGPSVPVFVLGWAAAMLVILLIGAVRLRRMDLE